MKILKIITMFICLYMTVGSTFAQQAYFDWKNNMDLYIQYNDQSDMIEALAVIPSQTNQNDQFSLGLFIDGREYRKFFKYNSETKLLFVEFKIPQDLDDNTSIYISIKDAQYNEVYTTLPTGYIGNYSSRNENNSVRSIFGLSSGQRDYGVFSMSVSTSGKMLDTTYNNSQEDNTNKRQNVSDLTRAELLNKVKGGDYTQKEIPEIIKSLENYDIIGNHNEKKEEIQKTQEIQKQTYIPRYSSQAGEPKTINGIGNSNTYNSWRVNK